MACRQRSRAVGRQFQRTWRIPKMSAPVLKLPLKHLPLHPLALPRCVIDILDRQGWKMRSHTFYSGSVQHSQFLEKNSQGPSICGYVMGADRKDVIVRLNDHEVHGEQRLSCKIEAMSGLFCQQPAGLLFANICIALAQIRNTQSEFIGGLDDREWLSVSAAKACSKHFVAPDD